jgi:hypothetical protein
MKLTVAVKGAELVRKGLQDLAAEIPKIGRQQIRVVMERIKRRMQEYPPEPAGQSVSSAHAILGTVYRPARRRYQRTGKLGASWAIEDTGTGYRIENNAARRGKLYGQYVVGDAYGTGQAWMHRGRWPLLRDVVEEEVEKLPPEIDKHISLAARRVGL